MPCRLLFNPFMKNIYLILLTVASISKSGHAQIGFEAGVNFANLAIQSNGTKVNSSYLIGAAFGMFADIRMGDGGHIYLEPGAFYQTNGANIKGNPNWKYIIGAANFPLSIEYKSGYKCGQRFFAGVGPYIGDNLNNSTNISDNYLQSTDFGVGFNIGFIGKKHLYIRARYQVGLMNELTGGDSKNYIKQSYGSLNLGYMIRGCRRGNGYGGSRRSKGNHWRGLRNNKWSTHQRLDRPAGPGF